MEEERQKQWMLQMAVLYAAVEILPPARFAFIILVNFHRPKFTLQILEYGVLDRDDIVQANMTFGTCNLPEADVTAPLPATANVTNFGHPNCRPISRIWWLLPTFSLAMLMS